MSEPDWETVCSECGYSRVDLEYMTRDRNEWVKKANAATDLASQYLRERDALEEMLVGARARANHWRQIAIENGKYQHRYRDALEKISWVTVPEGAEDPKQVQAFQWHLMRDIARHALNREE